MRSRAGGTPPVLTQRRPGLGRFSPPSRDHNAFETAEEAGKREEVLQEIERVAQDVYAEAAIAKVRPPAALGLPGGPAGALIGTSIPAMCCSIALTGS